MDALRAHLVNLGIPFGVAASYCVLAAQPDLRLALPVLVSVTAVVSILLAVSLYLGGKGAVRWTPRTILVMAAVLRLLFLFRPPELSDDVYRYLWDGLRTLSGHNPYSLAPADVQPIPDSLAHLAGRINHSDLITIYPPAAQLVFAAGASLGGGVLGLKLLLTAMDILTCHLILRLLVVLRMAPWRAVLYAWHPLPVLEITASGHIDGAGFLFFLVAFLAAVASRHEHFFGASPKGASGESHGRMALPLASGLAVGCAGLVKLFPLLFVPGCVAIQPKRSRSIFCIGFLAGVSILTACFMPDVRNGLTTLSVYAQHWESSGFAYRMLKTAGLSGNVARGVLSSMFFLCVVLFYKALWLGKRRRGQEQVEGAKECLQAPIPKDLEAFPTDVTNRPLKTALRIFYGIAAAFLLLTPTVFPWYALYLAGLLPFAAGPAGLVLAWSVFFSYQALIPYTLLGLWIESDSTAALVCMAPVGAFMVSELVRKLRSADG
jgi:hypothetical protein